MTSRRALGLVLATTLLTAGLASVPADAAAPAPAHCPGLRTIAVTAAEKQVQTCLDNMQTPGLIAAGRTDVNDWAGLNASDSKNPPGPVPGIQVDGYFHDDSTLNAEYGWFHDAQFVIRLPDNWNGKLVITGAPGVRKQFANDYIISDYVLAHGYAYASTDKGNSGTSFYDDGIIGQSPGGAVREWHQRVTELTRAAQALMRSHYGHSAAKTYMTGISNGGYLTRYALENHPELYDGGVDWEGTLFRPQGPNLFTYLPVALANYPAYAATGDPAAHQAMIDAGFAPGSEFLWPDHYSEYWDLTQRVYREEFDPGYDGHAVPSDPAGTPFCKTGTPAGTATACDTQYNYASRPTAVKDAVGSVSLTGHIGKPMLTLHGTLDALLPIKTDSDVYTKLIAAAGSGALSRYYTIDKGNHVDGRYDAHKTELRPILPCYRAAFEAMTAWVEKRTAPPPSGLVPASGPDVANVCALPGQ